MSKKIKITFCATLFVLALIVAVFGVFVSMNAVSAEEDNIFTVNVYDKNGNVIDTYTKKDRYPSIKAIKGYEGVYYAKMEGQDYMDDYLDFPFFNGMSSGNPEELGFVRNDELISKFPSSSAFKAYHLINNSAEQTLEYYNSDLRPSDINCYTEVIYLYEGSTCSVYYYIHKPFLPSFDGSSDSNLGIIFFNDDGDFVAEYTVNNSSGDLCFKINSKSLYNKDGNLITNLDSSIKTMSIYSLKSYMETIYLNMEIDSASFENGSFAISDYARNIDYDRDTINVYTDYVSENTTSVDTALIKKIAMIGAGAVIIIALVVSMTVAVMRKK